MKAPVIVFVYNRVDHVRRLMESLLLNAGIDGCDVFVFSDGAKNQASEQKVAQVRAYIDSIEKACPFRSMTVFQAPQNKGLARSIIDGVSQVISQYGKAIVIEDDNVLAADFIRYMNETLDHYEDNPKVWAVGGFSFPLDYPEDYQADVFWMQRLSSYAWGTWKDRWDKTQWEIPGYWRFLLNPAARSRFDRCGKDRSLMLDAQMCGKISSWAIRFEYSMMKNNMYAVMPRYSRTVCMGNDGSGTHSSRAVTAFDTHIVRMDRPVRYLDHGPDQRIVQSFRKKYKRSWKRKLLRNADFIFLYFKSKLCAKKKEN